MNISKTILASSTIVIAFTLVFAPLSLSEKVFAGGDNDENLAQQIISQVQKSTQNSQVVSGGDVKNSGNNFNLQAQQNSGSNAAAQSGDGDNKAAQGIGQSQSSSQNSQVVSGGNVENSGNNVNLQFQNNEGNNALAQQ